MESRVYRPASDTMLAFHKSDAPFRCIVGAVGSGKTTAALWEICYLLPRHMARMYNITHTRWAVVRKTYDRLMDTDWYEIDSWFPQNHWYAQRHIMVIRFPKSKGCPAFGVELYFRSLDQPDSMDKLRSMNLTGYWIDEAHEVHEYAKYMLITRLGRWPRDFVDPFGVDHKGSPVRYGVETSNPMPINHIMYRKYRWVGTKIDSKTGSLEMRRPPGPVPKGRPAKGYIGWWQLPRENEANLRPGYYEDMLDEFPESPEMRSMLVSGKPGFKPEGKGVYRNYDTENGTHMANGPLLWVRQIDPYSGEDKGVPLYAGWDNNGHNNLACIVGQVVGPFKLQVLREFTDERMNIIDYTNWVLSQLEQEFPGYTCTHYCFTAGTMIATSKGPVAIEDIRVGDMVLTRDGPHPVFNTMKRDVEDVRHYEIAGRDFYCTPDHPFYVGDGRFVPVDSLTPLDTPCIMTRKEQQQCESIIHCRSRLGGWYSDEDLTPTLRLIEYTTNVLREVVNEYSIVQYGLAFTARYLLGMISIMLTEILSITMHRIFNVSRPLSIGSDTVSRSRKWVERLLKEICEKPEKRQKSGIVPNRDVLGIERILQSLVNISLGFVRAVARAIWARPTLAFAQAVANKSFVGKMEKTEITDTVLSATENSGATSTDDNGVAPFPAEKDLRLKTVYNITVCDQHEYFAEGVLVSNCDPAAFSKFSAKEGGMTSNADLAMEACGIKLVPSIQALDVRINCVDQLLKMRDGMLIDPSCVGLINGFQGGYVYAERPTMGINAFHDEPKKNPFSHIHDALQYLVVPIFFPAMMKAAKESLESRMITNTFMPPWEAQKIVLAGAERAYSGGESATVDLDSRFGR